jgi:predicted DNA-binding antitoxin AbrB/MazE fold protein
MREPREISKMKGTHAFFANGVFKPTEPVDLPELSVVSFEPVLVDTKVMVGDEEADTYAILDEPYDTGLTDPSELHNDHQP